MNLNDEVVTKLIELDGGGLLATAHWTGVIRIWSLEIKREIQRFSKTGRIISSLIQLQQNSGLLASGSCGSIITI
jgi:WD40 repeat protein